MRESVLLNFGDTGWGALGTSLTGGFSVSGLADRLQLGIVKYFSPTTNLCIIRVARDHHRIAWGAVTLIKKIQGKIYIPNVIHVSGAVPHTLRWTWRVRFFRFFSGTIKHAQMEAITFNRISVAKLRALSKIPRKFVL